MVSSPGFIVRAVKPRPSDGGGGQEEFSRLAVPGPYALCRLIKGGPEPWGKSRSKGDDAKKVGPSTKSLICRGICFIIVRQIDYALCGKITDIQGGSSD